jgi:hypothetical protein
MDSAMLETTSLLFLRWFGKAFARWSAGVAQAPAGATSKPVLYVGVWPSLPHLDGVTKKLRALLESGHVRSGRMYIQLEKLRLWMRAEDEEMQKTGGSLKVGDTFRPYVLYVSSAHTQYLDSPLHSCALFSLWRERRVWYRYISNADAGTSILGRGDAKLIQDSWPVRPSELDVLAELLEMMVTSKTVPATLLVDHSLRELYYTLGPWLFRELGVRAIGNFCESASPRPSTLLSSSRLYCYVLCRQPNLSAAIAPAHHTTRARHTPQVQADRARRHR